MDWDKLKTFHFAAETGSLTAAADRLDISQSAVSRQIQALETAIGVPLFQRYARGLLLTEAGKTLHRATKEMAGVAALAASALQDARDRPLGDLRVTAPVAFGMTWLTPRIGSFLSAYPEVRLHLVLDDREFDLLKLEAEAAIRLWAATHADLVQRKILDVSVSLYGSEAYLKAHGAPDKPEDLDQHRIIAYGDQAHAQMRDLNWAQRVGREEAPLREATLTVNNVYAVMKAVECGFGIASLPDYMARENPKLVRILKDIQGPNFEVYFIYSSDLRRSKRIAAFRAFLLEQAQNWTN